jgi:predicted lipid carrier protein YhbT
MGWPPDARYATELEAEAETLRFTATDTGDSWLVTLTPAGVTRQAEAKAAETTVTAPATDLLLILNHRRDPHTINGDAALYERRRDGTRFWNCTYLGDMRVWT